ncbi:MAG: hypothetical protein ACPH74_07905 [Candidatus Puniceispirillum sp.]
MLFMGAVTGHGRHGDWAWGQDDPARRWLSMMMGMMAGVRADYAGIMRGDYAWFLAAGRAWDRAGKGLAK